MLITIYVKYPQVLNEVRVDIKQISQSSFMQYKWVIFIPDRSLNTFLFWLIYTIETYHFSHIDLMNVVWLFIHATFYCSISGW